MAGTPGLPPGNGRPRRDLSGQGGLLGGVAGQEHGLFAEAAREAGHGQAAADRPGRAGEAELAGDQAVAQPVGGKLAGRRENSDGDGQIVERAFLPQVAGREIDGGPGAQGLESAVGLGGGNAVVGFLDGRVRQSDEDELGLALLVGVDLHLHGLGFDPEQRGGGQKGEHAGL